MSPEIRERLAERLAALAHPARLRILEHLADLPACCCKDVVERMDLAQSTVSQHLKVLVQAGLVRMGTEGQRSRYEVDRDAVGELAASFDSMLKICCRGGGCAN